MTRKLRGTPATLFCAQAVGLEDSAPPYRNCEERQVVMEWLKHAFAVEPPGPVEPTEEQRAVVERVCVEVVRRGLTTPALMALEMSRPLNFVGAQALHFLAPIVSALTDAQGHKYFAAFLEHRGSIEYLCRRIEELEAERRNGTSDLRQPSEVPDRGFQEGE